MLSILARMMVRLIPFPSVRCRLRRIPAVRQCLRLIFGGEQSIAYPNSEFRLYYDGYRNIGVAGNGIEHCEAEEKCLVVRLLENLRPTVVWDIGANIGTWSMFLTTRLPRAEVRCFEPDPVNLKYLALNQTRNKIQTWTIRPVALSDRKGRMTFIGDPATGTTGSLERDEPWITKYFNAPTCELLVDVVMIDDEIRGGAAVPQFIKCDVEGHELAVFLGGLAMFRTHHPVIMYEDTGKAKVADLLRDLGYVLYDLNGKLLEKPAWNTLAVHNSQSIIMP